MARASPTTIAAVVLDVGARFRGHASVSTGVNNTKAEFRARVESGFAVMEITGTPILLMYANKLSSSSDSPDLLSANTMSPFLNIPASPCIASAGCKKDAGVPVDTMVAAIFCATEPDFPMPVTTTLPVHFINC